jgi:UDP-N-acetylmuramate--alanine ligase
MHLYINNKTIHLQGAYFIGAGGIGMSALARYFNKCGLFTAGYDKTPTPLTDQLIEEGIEIHFEDDIRLIPSHINEIPQDNLLVVYTPAIPTNHSEINRFKALGYTLFKRAEVLGALTNMFKVIAVSGTHGKTSVSTMISHIFNHSGIQINAFLGGISKNYDSNLILCDKPTDASFAIAEADEYDRSFLQLSPFTAVVTAIDPDHLDIYKDINDIRKTFEEFINKIDKQGNLVIKEGLKINKSNFPNKVYTYSQTQGSDFYPDDIETKPFESKFTVVTPFGRVEDLTIQVPGSVNIENAVAALAVSMIHGIPEDKIRNALATWKGVKRRFDYIVNTPDVVYIDDYAHHPEEIKSLLLSVRSIYKDKKITGIFQPHLFSRTRDMADDFAKSLSLLDELILLDIYPAREEPIPGITSKIIFDKVSVGNKLLVHKNELLDHISEFDKGILLTIGAGDISDMVDAVRKKVLRIES